MRANSLVIATAHTNGVITLEGMDRNEVRIIGASVGSLPGENRASNTFSFNIKKGEKGMIALAAIQKYGTGKNFCSESFEYFFGVKWEDGQEKPYIDLQNQWVPEDPMRLGHYYYDGLEVTIDGVTYSSNPDASEKEGKLKVKDANLLCRYMDSKISAEELREALGLPAKEQRAREELAKLQEHIQGMERQRAEDLKIIQCLDSTCEALAAQLKAAKERLFNRESELQTALAVKGMEIHNWKSAANRLKGAVEKQWFKRPTVDLALKMFPAE